MNDVVTQEVQKPRSLSDRVRDLHLEIDLIAKSLRVSDESNNALLGDLRRTALEVDGLKRQLQAAQAVGSEAARDELARVVRDDERHLERTKIVRYMREKAERYAQASDVPANPYAEMDMKVGLALRMLAETIEEGLHEAAVVNQKARTK